jgi:hypothetical protein
MKGKKTLVTAAAITVIGGLQQTGILNLVPAEYQGIAIASIGLVMAVLRFNTTTPVGKKF